MAKGREDLIVKNWFVLGFAAVAAYAVADTFTIVKWLQMTTYLDSYQNETVTTYPNTPPTGWNVTVANNAGQVNCVAATSRKRNQYDFAKAYRFGSATFEVKVETTKTPTSSCALNILYSGGTSATATAGWSIAYSDASGTLARPQYKTRSVYAILPTEEDSVTLGPGSEKRAIMFNNVSWTTTNGISEATFTVPSSSMSAKSSSYSPGGGSNMTATTGNAAVEGKLQIGGIKMAESGSNAGFISGTVNGYTDSVFVEIRNEYNAYVDGWWTGGTIGTFIFPMDLADGNYRLYFRAPGTLRKRVDVTYVGSTGLSGLSVTLRYGDLDGNNQVSATEVATILANVGKVNTQTSFFDFVRGTNYGVEDCDLNSDGQISSVDYLMALANSGAVGD